MTSRNLILFGCFSLLIFVSAISCNSSNENTSSPVTDIDESSYYAGKGFGPVTEINIADTIDEELALRGRSLFNSKCSTCHYANGEKLIGPALKGATSRRSPEWIMNMILNPLGMTQKDPLAREMLQVYMAQMTDQGLSIDEARALLEFLRQQDQKANQMLSGEEL